MTKDAAAEPQVRQKQLPAPHRLQTLPADGQGSPPIAALLQSIAQEISQSDQRQGHALADLRARLNLMTERQPDTLELTDPDEADVKKPVLALEDRRTARDQRSPVAGLSLTRVPYRETNQSAPIQGLDEAVRAIRTSAVPSEALEGPSDALARIYASVAQSYSEAATVRNADFQDQPQQWSATPRQPQTSSQHDISLDDSDEFMPLSALAEVYTPQPERAPAPSRPNSVSPVIEASLAVDKSIGDLSGRIAQIELKIEQALRQPADNPAVTAIGVHVEALRADLERLMAEHEKVSHVVGQVSTHVSALSDSAAKIGPMSDTVGHLNEAILMLRQELPVIADQAAERMRSHIPTEVPAPVENPELAEKLAIVQNLLLSRAVEQRETDTRSFGALESIRGLVQNLHNRIDAMEASESVPEAEPEQPAPVHSQHPSHFAVTEPPHAAEPAQPQAISPQALSREEMIASARRAALAASQIPPSIEADLPGRTTTADLRQLAASASRPASIVDRLGSRAFLTLAMVALLAAGLGMVYAKVIRKAPPKVTIERTALPAMPADLPDPVAAQPQAKVAPAKPVAPTQPVEAPAAKPAEKSSALAPGDLQGSADLPAANADAGGVQMASTASGMPSAETLPATIAPLSQRTAALAGDPAAAYTIADRYLKGTGVARDPAKAAHWYEKSAQAGSALAEFKLGVLQEKGDDGIAANSANAQDWYRRSASHGNVQAMHNLAVLYTSQVNGTPNYPEAAKWFEQAAGFGLKDSQYNLAVLYANGLGVTKDTNAAYKWFSIAALHGDTEAAKQRDALRKDLPAAQAAALDTQIKAWRAKPQDRKANTLDTLGTMGAAEPAAPVGKMSATTPDAGAASGIGSVQKMLAQLGYDPGTLDGTMTAQTHEAIKTFEERSGLPATGEVSDALMEKLRGLAG